MRGGKVLWNGKEALILVVLSSRTKNLQGKVKPPRTFKRS
jgi:hypothetical protein